MSKTMVRFFSRFFSFLSIHRTTTMEVLSAPGTAAAEIASASTSREQIMEEKTPPKEWEFGPCPMKNVLECTWEGRYQDIYEHFVNNHTENVNVIETDEIATLTWKNYLELSNKGSVFRVLLKSHGELFFFTVDGVGRIRRIQTNFFGNPEHADNYSCEITLKNDPDKVFAANMKMMCVWLPERDTTINEVYALPIFSSVLQKYCVNNDLDFCLKINVEENKM